MKKRCVYILSLFLLVACGKVESEIDAPAAGETLVLHVTAGDFRGDGQPSRTTDEGNKTRFENGDRVGVILVKNGAAIEGNNNLPYKYDGGQWVFDEDNGEGKKVRRVFPDMDYLVYYPYSAAADGVSDVAGLRAKFPPLADQSTAEGYRASDLMAANPRISANGTLNVSLKHVYASVSISTTLFLVLDDGKNTPVNDEAINRVVKNANTINFMKGDEFILPYRTSDNSFRVIIPAGFTGIIRYFCNLGWKNYVGEISLDMAAANTRYVYPIRLDLQYTRELAAPGDFCCRTAGGKVYFIPGENVLTNAQKQECKGILFHMRDSGSPSDAWGYDEFSGNPTGYIVSLDENKGQWSNNSWTDYFGSRSDIINGYQQSYKESHNSDRWLLDPNNNKILIESISMKWCKNKSQIANTADVTFSKWYMISIKEMYLLAEHFDMIQASLQQAGVQLQNDFYFTANRMGSEGNYVFTLNPKTLEADGWNNVLHNHPYRAAVAFQFK